MVKKCWMKKIFFRRFLDFEIILHFTGANSLGDPPVRHLLQFFKIKVSLIEIPDIQNLSVAEESLR